MQVINLATNDTWYNLYTVSGYTLGATLVVINTSSTRLSITHADTQPTSPADITYISPNETYLVQTDGPPVWIKGSTGPVVVQGASERLITPLMSADIPHDFYTGPKELYRRIKVDPGQTSFHDGREFRTFYEFNIASGTSLWIKVDVGVDTILYDVSIEVDAGSIRLTTHALGAPVGTYNTPLTILPKNTMSINGTPSYTTQNALHIGGTGATGTIPIDIARVVASGSTAQQTTVGTKAFDQRGVGAGQYFWQLENISNGPATGVFSSFWAEILNLGV